jgi:hypothetical protein
MQCAASCRLEMGFCGDTSSGFARTTSGMESVVARAPIWIAKRRQFLHVLVRVDGPAPGLADWSTPSYSFTSTARLPTDAEYLKSGLSSRAWSMRRQNVYAHYIRALGLDEEAVCEEVYSTTAVQLVNARIKFVPSGGVVNFTLEPAVDGGEKYVADVWTRIRSSFGEDMIRFGTGVRREQWRLTSLDRDQNKSLLHDGPTMKFAVEQALRGANLLCMSLTPKYDGMQLSCVATPGASFCACVRGRMETVVPCR